MSYQDIDEIKYSVKEVKFDELARQMRKHCALDRGMLTTLIRGLGVVDLTPDTNPSIFYIVTTDTIQSIPRGGSKDVKAAVLFGVSPSVALSEETCKAQFLAQIQRHHNKLDL